MNRWIYIALFVVVAVALFISGRIEAQRTQDSLEVARKQVDLQIRKENSGSNNPEDRTIFLKRQKQILTSIRPKVIATAAPASIPSPVGSESPAAVPATPAIALYMPYIVTLVFGLVSLGLILFKTDDESRKWAFATLGTIIGYWLKG